MCKGGMAESGQCDWFRASWVTKPMWVQSFFERTGGSPAPAALFEFENGKLIKTDFKITTGRKEISARYLYESY